MEFFRGIGTRLAAVLEFDLTIRQYVYVDKGQISTRVARHHCHQLMVLYLQQLHLTAICGCFPRFLCDVTLISEVNLRRMDLVDMVIVGWPCQGHSCVAASQSLKDPRSSNFWDLIQFMQWWFVYHPFPIGYIFKNVPLLENSQSKVLEGQYYVYQHLGDPISVNAMSFGSYFSRP